MSDRDTEDRVPLRGPYGITDLDHRCARCGEHITGCLSCAGERRAIVYVPYRGEDR